MGIRKIEDYEVWNRAMDLTVEVYKLMKLLPAEERFSLCDQMRRAAVSVPSNIAEGQGRGSDKEFVKFLNIARGSEAELRTQLQICVRLGYLKKEEAISAFDLCIKVESMISALIRRIRSNY